MNSDPHPTAPGSNPRDPRETLPRTVAPDAPDGKTAFRVASPAEYDLGEQFAEGGMGILYHARDRTFGRAVAVKVMRAGLSAEEFVREAKVTAQLPHPGIPPVYALGQLPDERPFLAMKFVNGHTLDAVLKKRADPGADRARLLVAFERVCETVGFAHTKRVVHRDLKPANLMLGDAGEVFVMDWGLATRAAAPARATAPAPPAPVEMSLAVAQSVAQGVKGTPAYMAPEQARGEPVDARADVFALGGILCAMLTGKAPIDGNTVLAAVMNAASGALDSAFARLDACGADPELIALAKRCLAPAREHRYATGSEVAAAVAAHRAGVEHRLRRAETDRAAADARAAEEANTRREAEARADAERNSAGADRKRRRVQLLLALAVALLVLAVAGFAWYIDHQRTVERRQQAELEKEQAQREKAEADERAARERDAGAARAALKLATDLRARRRYADAADALAQAEKLAAGARAAELQAAVRREKTDTALARDLDAIRADKFRWVSEPNGANGNFAFAEDPKAFGDRYAAALAARGFNVSSEPADAVAKKVSASAVRGEIVRALDDWALAVIDADPTAAERAIEVARRASPGDDMANRFRDFTLMRAKGPKALPKLPLPRDATEIVTSAPAVLLTSALFARRKDVSAGVVLAMGLAAFPNDFDIALATAQWYHTRDAGRAIGYNRVALALQPDHPAVLTNLGLLLTNTGEIGTAVVLLERAVKLHPDDHIAHFNLGGAVYARAENAPGDFDRADLARAEGVYRRTIELSPKYAAAHSNLGAVLGTQKRHGEARAALAEAVKLAPRDPTVRSNYGLALQRTGDLKGALREYELSIQLDPKYAAGHLNISAVLELMGDVPGARAALKRAAELDQATYGVEWEKFQKRHPEPK